MARQPKTAQDWYFDYEDALDKLVNGGLSAYSVGGQSFTKNDIKFVQEQMLFWKREMDAEANQTDGMSIVDMGL